MNAWGYDFWRYEPAPPLEVEAGIKLRSGRGRIGRTWWGRRWVETLESFDIGARLGRGRSYARKGQVAEMSIGAGEVTAAVQGTRREPYGISIALRAFTEKEWQAVMKRLRRAPQVIGALLNGEMPAQFEELFTAAGLSLFPGTSDDLETFCSCPDWSNPCKHIAAVYYILAEVFDDDPFLLLRLRGMDRTQFIAQLQSPARRTSGGDATAVGKEGANAQRMGTSASGEDGISAGVVSDAGTAGTMGAAAEAGEPLPEDVKMFWSSMERGPAAGSSSLQADIPEEHPETPVLISRLGTPPLWQSEYDFEAVMRLLYNHSADTATEYLLFGDREE